MQFTIAKTTIDNISRDLRTELEPVTAILGISKHDLDTLCGTQAEITHLKHVSLVDTGDTWVLWVNDEVALKHVQLIGKIARLAAPIIVACKMPMTELKRECESLSEFMQEPK